MPSKLVNGPEGNFLRVRSTLARFGGEGSELDDGEKDSSRSGSGLYVPSDGERDSALRRFLGVERDQDISLLSYAGVREAAFRMWSGISRPLCL